MDILFIQTTNKMGVLEQPSSPLGMLYLASIARKEGHNVVLKLCCTYNDGIVKFTTNLKDKQIQIFALSLYTAQILGQYQLIRAIKNARPDSKIIVGGPHASALPGQTLKDCPEIDFLIFGEGELTFSKLLDFLSYNNKPLDEIDGLAYRTNGEIKVNRPREFIRDLDSIPFPAYDLFMPYLTKYNRHALITTSRGCPFECEFCYKGIFQSVYRRRSPENVIEEVKMVVKDYNITYIDFVDDLFTSNKKWLDRFYSLKEEYNLNFKWGCMGRVTSYSMEDCRKMKEYGCVMINYGIESGNNEILKSIGKKTTVEQVQRAIETTKKAGIYTRGFFIFGHRNETKETMKDTLKLALKTKVASAIFFTMVPFPSSKSYAYVPDDLKYRWDLFYNHKKPGFRPISICSLPPKEIWKFSNKAIAKYYGRFSYLWELSIKSRLCKREKREVWRYWLCGIIARIFRIRLKYLFNIAR